MFKRITAALLCLVIMISFAGCAKKEVFSSDVENVENADSSPETVDVNLLTGLKNIDDKAANRRPVAIMMGNASDAIPVQSGLSKADIVFETEVEGGVTRLMAVYQDISKVEKIGSVRSARYPYVDLAMGLDAIYVHCGQDPTYCAPHLADCDDLNIDTNSKGAQRIANGLPSWNTLYAYGDKLFENISDTFDTKAKKATAFANFAAEDESLTLDAGAATKIYVPFPANKSRFEYNSSTGLYTRMVSGAAHTDHFNDEVTTVKNIFILLTTISNYPDGKHRKVDFDGGDGYYITNGTYQHIKWTKGDSSDGFKFTDTEGNELKVSAGNSWVCIPDKTTCNPTFE